MTRSRLDSFPNHYCLCLELYRDIRLQCMIRKSFVHRLSLILILDRISIEMCSVFDRFCTMKFSRFLLSHSKQLIHYSASVGSCQALFQTFLKSFQCPRAHPMPQRLGACTLRLREAFAFRWRQDRIIRALRALVNNFLKLFYINSIFCL